jgi:hypothetical protein
MSTITPRVGKRFVDSRLFARLTSIYGGIGPLRVFFYCMRPTI